MSFLSAVLKQQHLTAFDRAFIIKTEKGVRMKRLVVIGLTLIFSSSLYASNVKLHLSPLDEIVAVSDINLSQVQAKVLCQFTDPKNKKEDIIRERYILTRLDRIEEGRYRVRTGKAVLNAWLPEYKLVSCGYQLITLGEDLDGNALIGDITLLGKGLSHSEASATLKKRLAALLIGKLGEREDARLDDIIQN